MTIAISIKVGEGLVYAADSTSSFFNTNLGGQSELVQSFHHARKLIQLEDYPIGLMTFGLGSIGARNLESLVAEFENQLVRLEDRPPADVYTVEAIATDLRGFLAEKYDARFPAPAPAAAPQPVQEPADQPAPPADPAVKVDAVPPAPTVSPPDLRPPMGVIIGGTLEVHSSPTSS